MRTIGVKSSPAPIWSPSWRLARGWLRVALLVYVVVLSGQSLGWAAAVPFATPPAISTTADGAISVFAADVDGDGDMDVLSASNIGDKIAWYENTDGAGTFSAPQVISTLTDGAWSVFAADVDGDGDTDVLSASFWDDKIAWYENDGTPGGLGDWGEHGISTLANGAISVFAADVDGDGDMDVLSASYSDDKIAWYENTDGAGTFSAQHVISTLADGARSVFAADVDGDGDTDVLSTSEQDDKIAWYENTDGAGTFSAQHVISTPADGPYSVFAADLDGDEDIDVLVATLHQIAWYENTDGAGTFSARQVISTFGNFARSVFAADVDGDGDTDVLSASEVDDKIAWYENTDGAGTFSAQLVISTLADGAWSVFAADVDGDGDTDVLSASYFDDKIAWYQNRTIHRSAAFAEQSVIATPVQPYGVFAADVDSDGAMDVLYASFDGEVAWQRNNGGSPPSFSHHTITTSAPGAVSVFGADVDGDGDVDVLSASETDDTIAWYRNTDGAGTFGPRQAIATNVDQAECVFAADLDGDGDTDVLGTALLGNAVLWYENNGGLPPSWGTPHTIAVAQGPVKVRAADLDGDGDLDVMADGAFGLAWYRNDGGSPLVWAPQVISLATSTFFGLRAADVDGDGDLDIVVSRLDTGTVLWFENDGTPGGLGDWAEHVIATDAAFAHDVMTADADSDGDIDVFAVSGGNVANNSKVSWYESDGGSPPAWRAHTISTVGVYPYAVYAADLDGDGDVDALAGWANVPTRVAWYENRGGQFALATTNTAAATINPGATDDMLKIVLTHNGRMGDTNVELATLELLFEESLGDPLTSAEANAVIENLRVYLDTGSGVFESGADTLVATVGTLALASGVQTVTLTDGDPNVRVAQGTPRTYFVVVETTANAATQVPNRFRVTHRTESSSKAEDAGADIPLSLEFVANLPSGFVDVPPQVIAVVPQDNALDVPVGTNVTVVFSEPVNPATVTTSTFRLLAPGGTPVTASVGLAPDGKTATLDPSAALSFGTVYTVDVTSGVTDLAGTPAVPFTSRFNTVAAVAGIPLPTVSNQSVLPSPPPFLPPGKAPNAPTTVGANLGYSVASAGDLNNDGLGDFVGGAPGYAPGGRTEAGGVAVYLGSNAPEPSSGNHPREVAEIIFTGSAAHDRAGSSVAGGFDFDGDGIEDLLIGAEQVDRTLQPAVETGPGKVYLILFKPLQYDRLPVDGVPDYLVNPEMFVPLAEVGSTISGVVFSGVTLGDQAGYAVSGGGRLESGDARDDIVIGAPGASGDNGKAYVVFSNPALSGAKALADVGGTIAGVVYQGSSAERLGSSLALPGDVTNSTGPDIAMGAPDANTTQAGAGKVYVATAGSLASGTVNASSIATQIQGDQAGEHLGFAVAGGGDNRADGNPTLPGGDFDLLIGAPDYSPIAIANAGRVVQTSARLPAGVIQAGQVGTTVPGIIWRGTQAGGHLGWSVARLGDMSGNVLEDIGLGAPDANPGISDAGAVYVVEGSANVGLLGTVDASLVGQTVSGGIFLGTQASERAGLVLAGVGDLDGDTTSAPNDWTVGSPGWDGENGTVHQVLGSILQQPGQCTALGCTVADLSTGALLEVAPNALAAQARFQVRGLVTPAATACSANSLAGKTLVGTSDDTRIDCGAPPCPPPGFGVRPNIEVPARAEVDYQLVNGEALELRYCDATLGWRPLSAPAPPTGTVKANTFLPAPRKAVRALGVDTLHLFGVFFADGDQDGSRLGCDCNDTDATLWDRPFLVDTLLLSQNRITGVTTLTWMAPAFPGGTAALRYDTVRSTSRSSFVAGASCVEGDGTDMTSTDATNPTTGQVFYYIVVPQNNCPAHATCFNPDPRTPALECTGS